MNTDLEPGKELINKARLPYKKECIRILIYLLIGSFSALALDSMAADVSGRGDHTWAMACLVCIIPTCFIGMLGYAERAFWFSLIEKWRGRYVTARMEIIGLKPERGLLEMYGVMPGLFDDKLEVDKYILVCIAESGEYIHLRSAMSKKKMELLSQTPTEGNSITVWVTYGELSHIVIKYEDPREEFRQLNEML